MIGVDNGHKRIACIIQSGKHFIHIVFPLKQPYSDNLCFQRFAWAPGDSKQFNHHFCIYNKEDITEEVVAFLKLALEETFIASI